VGTIWEQIANFAVFNPEIKSKPMKVTAFIRKTAKKNDVDTKATIYFRLRDGKKDIKATSELSISPKGSPKTKKTDQRIKKQKLPTAISPKAKSDSPQKIPSSVSDRKAEKQSTAKRSAGCLSEASSCASDERSFAAGPKLQTAVFLFVTFFFLPPKRKSKSKQ
jgi:hypothetical protein